MNRRNFTVNNWGYPPHNRESFQHVQTLFPTGRLRRNLELGESRSVRLNDFGGVGFLGASGVESTVQQMIDDGFTDAFLVSHKGVLLTEFYDNGMTQDQHHLVNSVTKTFVGMLAGIAVENGQLSPDRQVTEYLPELNSSAWEGTTVRQVLDMTAGVSYLEDYDDRATDFWKETAVVGWRPALVSETTPQSLHDYAVSLRGKDFMDGEKFKYKTVLTNVLGMLLERVMEQPLATLLEGNIWSQLPMRQDGIVVVDREGFPYVGAGLNSCARDLLTFGELLMSGGAYNGKQIIPQAWIDDTVKGDTGSKKSFSDGEYGELLVGWHYRNQVWMTDQPGEMLAIGIHGQLIYINAPAEVVVVKLSSYPSSADALRVADSYAAANAIAASLS